MSGMLLSRIIGAIIFGIIGAVSGLPIFKHLEVFFPNVDPNHGLIIAIFAVVLWCLVLLLHLISPSNRLKVLKNCLVKPVRKVCLAVWLVFCLVLWPQQSQHIPFHFYQNHLDQLCRLWLWCFSVICFLLCFLREMKIFRQCLKA